MSTATLTASTAIVTGASRGFGRAIAVALVAHGAHVVGVARDEAALDDLQRQLGPAFTPVVADVADDTLATRLIAEYRPRIMVLNAGATPHAATLQDHTWQTFSENWNVDVKHVFDFAREALVAPLEPGSTVTSLSSGAARMGSPMSGGYAGAKATINFISAYAGAHSERNSLGIRFVALLPKLTPATRLGSTFVDAYADYDEVGREAFREQLGATLTAEQAADAVLEIVHGAGRRAAAYLLTSGGLTELA
ncbi:MAG: short-chain dehydrogenase/reductase [Ilumatobacteraceae bacterium]|nr:short-chain dehydrogenase/reductase [Ilumatobacteraceae bacterium]